MRKGFLPIGLITVFVIALVLAGCGSSDYTTSTNPTEPSSGTVPVSFSMGDDPPTGVTVLRFQVQVTSAMLEPTDSSQSPVNMLTGPMNIELLQLQTETALLANANVPAGSYSELTVAFANPEMTIFNQSSSTLTVGSQSCAANQVCILNPTLNSSSVTVSSPTNPFPITLSANSPVGIAMHFDVNASVQGNLSVTPTVVLDQTVPSTVSSPILSFHVIGTITALASPNFSLQTGFMNTSATIETTSNTQYDFSETCTSDSFSCLETGEVVRVDLDLLSGGTLVAKRVRLLGPASKPLIEGAVINVNTTGDTFQVVLVDMQGPFSGVVFGMPLTVQVTNSTTFGIDTDGMTLPSGVSFTGISSMMVGQVVAFHPTGVAVTSGSGPAMSATLSTDAVTLEDSEMTGVVSSVNASATPPNFVLGTLAPLFTKAGISSIEVVPVSTTTYIGVSGLSGIDVNDIVSVGGLLFNTSGTPTFVAARVFDRRAIPVSASVAAQ
jgi:Domain of unknown function (DUF4382)/Domain of unknown function (DUF5666)